MRSKRRQKNAVITITIAITAVIILAIIFTVGAITKHQSQLTVVTAENSESNLVKNVWNPFEKKTKIKINGIIKPNLSLRSKANTVPNNTDIIESSQSNTVMNNKNDKLEKLDFKKLRNFKYLSSDNQKLAKKTNSIPYVVETTDVIYNPKTASAINNVGQLWDQANFKKLGLPDINTPMGAVMIYMGNDYMRYRSTSSYVGYSIDNDGTPAFEALKQLQPNAKIYRNVSDLKKQFQTKQIDMAMVDSTTAITMRKADPTLKLAGWGFGNFANYRMVSIVKGTKNKAAAYKYLDNRIAESVQRRVSKDMNELPTNQAVQKTDANFSTYGSDDMVTLDYEYMNEHQADFVKRWNEIFE